MRERQEAGLKASLTSPPCSPCIQLSFFLSPEMDNKETTVTRSYDASHVRDRKLHAVLVNRKDLMLSISDQH